MRKTECELNASFGLIRVFASAALEPENPMAEVVGAGLSGRRACTVFNAPWAARKLPAVSITTLPP